MIKTKIYFDYIDGEKAPTWIVINIRENEINLHSDKLSVELAFPFEVHQIDDMDQYNVNASILLSDLYIDAYHPNEFGINMKAVKERMDQVGVDYVLLENLVVRFVDVAEVLHIQEAI